MSEFRICSTEEVKHAGAIPFAFVRDQKKVSAFVAYFQGTIVAYENVCRHLPVSLDYGDNRFFSRDGRHLICQTHGAIYEPLTGLCVRGPCKGDSLKQLKIDVRKGEVWLVEDKVERLLEKREI